MMGRITSETPKNLILYFKLIYCLFYNVICDFRINASELDITFNMIGSIAYEIPGSIHNANVTHKFGRNKRHYLVFFPPNPRYFMLGRGW